MSDFEWSSGGQYAPEGIYDAAFLGYEHVPAGQYGEGWQFNFKVVGGAHDGKLSSRIGAKKPTDGNITGRIIKGLLGASFKTGDNPDVNSCVGKTYQIVVKSNENARAVVDMVLAK